MGSKEGTIAPIPQDNELATVARSLTSRRRGDRLDYAADDDREPHSGLHAEARGVHEARGYSGQDLERGCGDDDGQRGAPGEIVGSERMGSRSRRRSGSVRLIEVQPDSRKRMTAADLARGGVKVGARFEA